MAPAIWCRLKRTRHQGTQWEAQDTAPEESGFLPQERWEPAQRMLDGAVRPQLSSVGADCALSPWETALQAGRRWERWAGEVQQFANKGTTRPGKFRN